MTYEEQQTMRDEYLFAEFKIHPEVLKPDADHAKFIFDMEHEES